MPNCLLLIFCKYSCRTCLISLGVRIFSGLRSCLAPAQSAKIQYVQKHNHIMKKLIKSIISLFTWDYKKAEVQQNNNRHSPISSKGCNWYPIYETQSYFVKLTNYEYQFRSLLVLLCERQYVQEKEVHPLFFCGFDFTCPKELATQKIIAPFDYYFEELLIWVMVLISANMY